MIPRKKQFKPTPAAKLKIVMHRHAGWQPKKSNSRIVLVRRRASLVSWAFGHGGFTMVRVICSVGPRRWRWNTLMRSQWPMIMREHRRSVPLRDRGTKPVMI